MYTQEREREVEQRAASRPSSPPKSRPASARARPRTAEGRRTTAKTVQGERGDEEGAAPLSAGETREYEALSKRADFLLLLQEAWRVNFDVLGLPAIK